jgi:Family of unknown function (DUF6427)
MLLRILKSNSLISSLLIPVIALLFWLHNLQSPAPLDLSRANGGMPLYYLACHFLSNSNFWQVFLAFVLVVLNSLFLSQLGSTYIFLNKRSYLPGIVYLITVSSLVSLQAFLPVHLATSFVLIAIYFIFDTFHRKVAITHTFNASFFLAIGSLIYLPVIALFPLVWISIFVLQKDDNWRLLAVPVLGFGAPWLFMGVYSFLTDSYHILWKELIEMLWTRHNEYLLEPYFLLLTAIVSLLTLLGSLSVLGVFQMIKVSSRKYFVICYWILGLVTIPALLFITISIEIVALSTIPVAYFISQYLNSDSNILKEILTWIYIFISVLVLIMYA